MLNEKNKTYLSFDFMVDNVALSLRQIEIFWMQIMSPNLNHLWRQNCDFYRSCLFSIKNSLIFID